MKIYIDSASARIHHLITNYNLDGATSNPTILARYEQTLEGFYNEIPKGKKFFMQVVATDHNTMIEQGIQLTKLFSGVIVKVPATSEGLMAIRTLNDRGIPTLATAIISLEQAVLAIKCGAKYLAPYVNRMIKNGVDGIKVCQQIVDYCMLHDLNVEVIGASFLDKDQLIKVINSGIHAITISEAIFDDLMRNEIVDQYVETFEKDWLIIKDGTFDVS